MKKPSDSENWRRREGGRRAVSMARSGGGELEVKRQRKKKEWGVKSESYPRSPIYTAGRWSWVRW
jgi:hypothetical protein